MDSAAKPYERGWVVGSAEEALRLLTDMLPGWTGCVERTTNPEPTPWGMVSVRGPCGRSYTFPFCDPEDPVALLNRVVIDIRRGRERPE
jgi:hypothetical protein